MAEVTVAFGPGCIVKWMHHCIFESVSHPPATVTPLSLLRAPAPPMTCDS